MSSYQLPPWVWPVALFTVCLIAAWRGDRDARIAAGGYLLNYAIGVFVYRARSNETQWAVLALDVALLCLLVWLALHSRRHWPLFAAGFQLLAVVTHVASALDPTLGGWAYITASIIWSYLVIFAVGYGGWTAPRYAGAAAGVDATRR